MSVLGPVLQGFTWTLSPDVEREKAKLAALAPALKQCTTSRMPSPLASLREEQYRAARQELQRRRGVVSETSLAPALGFPGGNADIFKSARIAAYDSIGQMSETYRGQQEKEDAAVPVFDEQSPYRQYTPRSLLMFVVEMLQYRYVSFYSYLETYSTAADHPVDLVGAAMVDYDWWLSSGATTHSALPNQAELMSDISVATGGRVHAWVPFCPLREVVFRTRGLGFSSLELVKRQVLEHGALGIKLYPPMGFAPLGNAELDPQIWRAAPWLPPEATRPGFGKRLDAVLRELFQWCVSLDVPILAHANDSNGATIQFKELALAPHWERTFADPGLGGLRVNFGHFGGAANSDHADKAKAFLQLMLKPGIQHAYADSSYFRDLLDHPEQLESALSVIFSAEAPPHRVLASRFLFGTDWKMLLAEAHAGHYSERFLTLLKELGSRPEFKDISGLPQRVMGGNATDFLGLHKGDQTRNRLETFYKARGVGKPGWMEKVDSNA
jgi:hypothetical protein